MNLLIISLYFPPDMGGASNRAWNAATGLAKRGHKVKVIAGFPHYPLGDIPEKIRRKAIVKEQQGKIEVFRVWVPPLPTEGILKRLLIYLSFMWSSLFAYFWIGPVEGIFYVSPFSSTFVIPGLFYHVSKRAHLILDCGDMWPNSAVDLGFLKSKWLVRLARLTSYLSYRLADGIAPIDDSIKRGIILEYGVEERKVHTVNLGIDTEVIKPAPKDASLVSKERLNGKFVVMYSGILGPAYDFDVILKAAKILEPFRDVVFVIRGDGELKDNISRRAQQQKIGNLIMLPKVEGLDRVVAYLNLADVFVLPMKNVQVSVTAIPSKVYEFFACGKPVICCARGELSDLIKEHSAGIAVKVGDGEELAETILYLFGNRKLCVELGKNARQAVLKNFSNEEVGRKLENVFLGSEWRAPETHNVKRMRFDIALIRSDSISNDPRVLKISRSLSSRYGVLVLGWDREMRHESCEIIGNRVSVRRLRLKAPYGKITLVLFYPLFWVWIFCNLLVFRPKIVHACDLDTLIPSYLFKMLFSSKIVFDSFDRYAMAFIPPKHHAIYTLVHTIEGLMAYKSDALVTVSRKRLTTFGNRLPKHSEVVMNCPEDVLDITRNDTRMFSDYELTLVHAGGIGRTVGLFLLDDAIKNLDDVRLVLAGRRDDKGTIEQLLRNPKIKYVGLLEHSKALKLEGTADIIPIFYDPALPISRVANPNKLFEAMMLGVPVITNVCADIVNGVGCGLVVEYDANEVRKAILDLKRSPAIRRNMGIKGRLAFEKTYNWTIMEKRLLGLYDKLQPVPDERTPRAQIA